ncbi:MAG: Asp-tRNA(Asn)/Glu-tRNA(Gln) amidotransferase subunit GatA [Gemmatimonadota bacterium]|nr:Asp-tRNA(Asn)/Glu-tRNA(Gln) amidotransferase subunit GatA [Gemmatimonadota bacterium]
MKEIRKLSGCELAAGIASGEVSSTEAVEKHLAAIEADDHNCLISVRSEEALAEAGAVDRALASGEKLPPSAGLPVIIKDNMVVRGGETTCASKILKNFISPYDSHVVEQLGKARMIILGKANMDEFAMGSSNENSAYGPVRGPVDPARVPGGSSGGSATSVALGLTPVALGSDTGGSIRQPASFCGVVGLKPTYGRVSRYGLVAYGSSLDQIGPLTRTVEDAAMLLEVIAGHDPRDSTSADQEVPDYREMIKGDIKGLRVGLPREYFPGSLDPGVRDRVMAQVARLEELGAETVEISLPHTEYAIAAYYIVATAEASANLARFDGVRYGHRSREASDLIEMYRTSRSQGFGPEVKRRIMLGTYVLSAGYYDAYYLKAQRVRTLITNDFLEAFKKVDLIVTPTAPSPAFKLGALTDNPVQMYLQDIFTVTINLSGVPAVSVPAGLVDGLPVGVQIIGRHFDEGTVLKIASKLEGGRQ